MSKKVAALIPARSGSQGVRNKNIANLGGIPLLGHAVNAAISSDFFQDVYVSSDSPEYLEVAKKYGALTILRPRELASDTASTYSVVEHFILNYKNYDHVCILYPTYPFRSAESIKKFMGHYFSQSRSYDSMIGLKLPRTHPYLIYELENKNGLMRASFNPDANNYFRRQDYPNKYLELCHWTAVVNASAISRLNAQLISSNTLGYKIPSNENTTDIDTIADFKLAELFIKENNIN